MGKLYISDIFKIFNNREASKLKIWEIIRSYPPMEFLKLIYLLENVTTVTNRNAVSLEDDMIKYNPNDFKCDKFLEIKDVPVIRLERGVYESESSEIFWNNDGSIGEDDGDDYEIQTLLDHIRANKQMPLEATPKALRFKVLNHNIGTSHYKTLLGQISNLLFNDNYQIDRNEQQLEHSSVFAKFLQFYKAMTFKQGDDIDVRSFRNIIISKPTRTFDRTLVSSQSHIVQPLYQGLHVVVYSSPSETKCYTRFGALLNGLAQSMRCAVPCTFEAIILPIDRFKNVRCWKYWPFRAGYVLYVVDVFRYKQTILTTIPFKNRIQYIDLIVKNNPNILFSAHALTNTWASIEDTYIKTRDMYDPIVGVVLRDPNHTFSEQDKSLSALAFYFNILVSFNILDSKIIDLKESHPPEIIRDLHLNREMADYKTVCIVYGHCDEFLYICMYNRTLHQFVHAAMLRRSPVEYIVLAYKSEKIYIVNNKTMPRGILYLRIYYDVFRNIIGYEQKLTDDRFKIPYTDPLLLAAK